MLCSEPCLGLDFPRSTDTVHVHPPHLAMPIFFQEPCEIARKQLGRIYYYNMLRGRTLRSDSSRSTSSAAQPGCGGAWTETQPVTPDSPQPPSQTPELPLVVALIPLRCPFQVIPCSLPVYTERLVRAGSLSLWSLLHSRHSRTMRGKDADPESHDLPPPPPASYPSSAICEAVLIH